MNRKIILGILSVDPYTGKQEFLSQLENRGFGIYDVTSKVKEMAKYILKNNIISEDDINKIRKKGYSVNRLFWINLLMASVDKERDIVIKDLWEEDLYGNYILPIISDPIILPNIKHIKYPEKNLNIKSWLDEIGK